MSSWHQRLGVFDLETTGIDVESARIVTAHVGLLDETGQVLHRRDWILDPVVEIPAEATAVHGITTERARQDGMDAARGIAAAISPSAKTDQSGSTPKTDQSGSTPKTDQSIEPGHPQ